MDEASDLPLSGLSWDAGHMVKKQGKKGVSTKRTSGIRRLTISKVLRYFGVTKPVVYSLHAAMLSPKLLLEQLIANNEKPNSKST